MNNVIDIIGKTIIICKYTLVFLIAGLTITTGAGAADPMFVLALEGND